MQALSCKHVVISQKWHQTSYMVSKSNQKSRGIVKSTFLSGHFIVISALYILYYEDEDDNRE